MESDPRLQASLNAVNNKWVQSPNQLYFVPQGIMFRSVFVLSSSGPGFLSFCAAFWGTGPHAGKTGPELDLFDNLFVIRFRVLSDQARSYL